MFVFQPCGCCSLETLIKTQEPAEAKLGLAGAREVHRGSLCWSLAQPDWSWSDICGGKLGTVPPHAVLGVPAVGTGTGAPCSRAQALPDGSVVHSSVPLPAGCLEGTPSVLMPDVSA